MAKKDILTGIRAETGFVTRMGGIHYGKQAGSQATDIIMSHDDHGDVNTEMKGGPTVDHVQTRMDVDAVSGEMRQTVKSQQMSGDVLSSSIHPVTGKTRKFGQMINRHLQKRGITPEPGTAEYTRISKKSGKEKVEKRPAGMETVAQSGMKKLSLNNKNGVAMMHMGDDKVHVAIHHQTGKVALIPTSDEHRHLGDKMGLNKTVTYDDLAGDDHGHKDTLGLKARPPRAKGGTFNVSLETSSGNMVNAVDDAGGHVFDSLDHATDHLRSYGWTARSGHAMSESVGMLLQGKYHEAVALNEVTTKLTEVINPLRLQGALTYRDMFVDLFGDKKADDKPDDKTDPIDLRQSDKDKRLSLLDPKNVPTIDISGPTSVTGYNPVALDDIIGQLEDQDKAAKAASKAAQEQGQFGTKFGSAERDAEYRRRTEARARNESVFHIASVLHEDDENYSDDEIARDKDPNAAGGPYSEDDIKVTQDPRDAAPGMDPVADPPTQQAKQVTTGMVSKAPAAAGTMQTMLPGGEHDAIMNQYPDLIEGLCGGKSDMKGDFLTDPKDKKKAAAAFALMASLDKKLKEDKAARLSKILNNNKPPAIPGSEGY
jgi:hypothetical protein